MNLTKILEKHAEEIVDMMDKHIKGENIEDYRKCLGVLKEVESLINSEKKGDNLYINRTQTYL